MEMNKWVLAGCTALGCLVGRPGLGAAAGLVAGGLAKEFGKIRVVQKKKAKKPEKKDE
ncbi:MAG: hypothetical protein ABIG71_00725 [Candidatus Uhrbacteria bacterium]